MITLTTLMPQIRQYVTDHPGSSPSEIIAWLRTHEASTISDFDIRSALLRMTVAGILGVNSDNTLFVYCPQRTDGTWTWTRCGKVVGHLPPCRPMIHFLSGPSPLAADRKLYDYALSVANRHTAHGMTSEQKNNAFDAYRASLSDSPPPPQAEFAVRRYTVFICDDCFNLKGDECHNPECVFCRRAMTEVAHILDVLLIRPVIDGRRLDMGTPEAHA